MLVKLAKMTGAAALAAVLSVVLMVIIMAVVTFYVRRSGTEDLV